MLSYRHAFHAGNPADVLKHCMLAEAIGLMRKKEKPFRYVDTHSGAGGYDVLSGYAAQNREWEAGAANLLKIADDPSIPSMVSRWLAVVKGFNSGGKFVRYPGSPLIALRLLREADDAYFFELHPSDRPLLESSLAENPKFKVRDSDGFAGLASVFPPPSRRGLVLMDPSYELKSDYAAVVKSLAAAHRRFATGVYLVWYPLLESDEAKRLPVELRSYAERTGSPWMDAVLKTSFPREDGYGMTGSGVFVLNPPWTLEERAREALPWLSERLGNEGARGWTCESGEPVAK